MSRAGFTLLEVLLATAIAVVLMGALYVSVSVQLRHAQAGREVVERSTLVRALLTRFATDVTASLGPITANVPSTSSGSSAGVLPATQSAPPSTGAAPAGSSSGDSTPTAASIGVSTPGNFNLGIQGDANRIILYVSRVPRELDASSASPVDLESSLGVSDLRRISYWLAAGAGVPLGLARQEVKQVTSDEAAASLPPDVPDEGSYVIAEEVKSLTFSYFDGNAWQDGWDGSSPGSDGVTPLGPPLAVAIRVGIAAPGTEELTYYRHVVAVPTSNGLIQPNASGNRP